MKRPLQSSLPQLCAESLTRRAARPPCGGAGGLAETRRGARTADAHAGHLLTHLGNTERAQFKKLTSLFFF